MTLKEFIKALPQDKKSLNTRVLFHTSDRLDLEFLSVYANPGGDLINIDVGGEDE